MSEQKWWLISDDDTKIIQEELLRNFQADEKTKNALMHLETGLHLTDEVPDDYKEHPTIKVEKTIDQWTSTYDYYVAKSHRYDGAWLISGLLDIDIADNWGDPCEKEAFKKRLIEKYNSLSETKIEET